MIAPQLKHHVEGAMNESGDRRPISGTALPFIFLGVRQNMRSAHSRALASMRRLEDKELLIERQRAYSRSTRYPSRRMLACSTETVGRTDSNEPITRSKQADIEVGSWGSLLHEYEMLQAVRQIDIRTFGGSTTAAIFIVKMLPLLHSATKSIRFANDLARSAIAWHTGDFSKCL